VPYCDTISRQVSPFCVANILKASLTCQPVFHRSSRLQPSNMLSNYKSKIQGKTIKRLLSTSCAIVWPISSIFDIAFSDKSQSFLLYGYDAGVLGGVQETKPFLHAMGVSNNRLSNEMKHIFLIITDSEPYRNLCHPDDSFSIHSCRYSLLACSYRHWHAPWSTRVHPSGKRVCCGWW